MVYSSSNSDNLKQLPPNLLNYLYNAKAFRPVGDSSAIVKVTTEEIVETVTIVKDSERPEPKDAPKCWDIDEEDVKKLNKKEFLKYQKHLLRYEKTAVQERDMKKFLAVGGKEESAVISNLTVDEMYYDRFGKVEVVLVDSDYDLPGQAFRRGDLVTLFSDWFSTEGVISHVDDSVISVTVDSEFLFDKNTFFSLMHHPTLENHKRILAGISRIADYSGPANGPCDVIFGERNSLPPLKNLPSQLCDRNNQLTFSNGNLDDSQKKAVEFVLKQQELGIIHGPPGTGKSTTIIEIIKQHFHLNKKILCLAPSNQGVDNLVTRLAAAGLSIVRIGHPSRTSKEASRYTLDAQLNRGDNLKDWQEIEDKMAEVQDDDSLSYQEKYDLLVMFKKLQKDLQGGQDEETERIIRGADVVLGTLLSVNEQGIFRFLPEDHFGLTVIDECGQGIEVACYPGVMRAPKLLLVGDHKQLPPTVLHPKASYLLNSLMERMIRKYGDDVVRMLKTQYRMNETIMQWTSEEMYKGQLQAAASVKSHLLCDLPKVETNELTSFPLNLVDTSGCPGFEEAEAKQFQLKEGTCNEGEARLVSRLVMRLIDSGLSQEKIAVISPYNKQVKLVRALVQTLYPDVEVQTVDSFQGREKEAVILSLVRSNTRGNVGFLSNERRLNVAITRARRNLTVVCNGTTLRKNDFLANFLDYMAEKANILQADQLEQIPQQSKLKTPKRKSNNMEHNLEDLEPSPKISRSSY